MLLAALAVTGGAALGAAAWVSGSDRTVVVVAARDIPVGAQIDAQDLRAAEIDGAGIAAIAGSDAGGLLGQTATTAIPAGTLMNADMVQQEPPPGPGRVAVGLSLPTGRMPVELASGRQVQVMMVLGAQDGSSEPVGRVIVAAATVLSVTPDTSGAFLVSIAVEASDAELVTSAAALDRLTLVMLPVQTSPGPESRPVSGSGD